MEQYTDDERVEDLKKWWKENGASILIGIALGVMAIFGWQYWGAHRNAQAETASRAYDAFIEAVEKPDPDQARQRGQILTTDFPKSPYATLAALRLAKLAVDRSDDATANQQLEWVISNAQLDEFKDIARLRLARVKLASQPVEAEKLLNSVTTTSLSAEREELKGDLYLNGKNPDKARTAYTAALAASGGNPLLQLKLDNLAVATPETVVAAPATPASPPPPTPSVPEPAQPEAPLAPATNPAEPVPAPTPPAVPTEPQATAPTEPAATTTSSAVPTEPQATAPTEPAPASTPPAVPTEPQATAPTEPAPVSTPPAATPGQ